MVHYLPKRLSKNTYALGREDLPALCSYILSRRGNAIPAPCRGAAWVFMEQGFDKCIVGKDWVGDVEVSTVFLTINHQFGKGPPVLWESMVFGGPSDGTCHRYTSNIEAREGHRSMLAQQKALAAEGLEM